MTGLASPEIKPALRRFSWLIVGAAIIGAIAGLVVGARMPPAYEATAKLVVGPGRDAASPDVVIKRLEYLYDAFLADTAAAIAGDEELIEEASAVAGLSLAGYDVSAEVSGTAELVEITATGSSASGAAQLADQVARLTEQRFTAAYPDYSIDVVDRRLDAAWTPGTPSYALPISLALLGSLAAFAFAVIAHNRLFPRTPVPSPVGAEATEATREERARLPILNRDHALRNVAIGVAVGVAAGLVAAGFGAATFTAVAVVVTTAAAAAVIRPEWALVGLITLVTLRLAEIAQDVYGVPQVTIPVIGAVCAVLAMRWVVWRERPTGWLVAAGAIGFVAIAAWVSVLNAEYPAASVAQIAEFGKSAVVFLLVVVLINTARDFRVAMWALIVLGGFVASLSVVQYLTGAFEQSFFGLAQARYMNIAFDYNDYRIAGPFGDPNFYGQALVPICAIALERAWHERRRVLRVGAAMATGVTALAIVFTFSRGALLALLVVGVAALFTLRPGLRAIALGGLLLAVLLVMLPSDYVTRATALFESDQSAELTIDPSVNQRTSILRSGLLMFTDYPVAGVGIGNFPDRYLQYAADVGIEQERTKIEPHSFYVEIAAETGVVGLVAWGAVALLGFEMVRAARRSLALAGETELRHMVTAFAVGLSGFFTAALFLHLAYARYMWVLLGIVFALPKVAASVTAHQESNSSMVSGS